MKVVSKDNLVYIAYKDSHGYMSSGYEGPLYFSKKSNGTVDGGKNKDGLVLFLDKDSAEEFKRNFDAYYEQHGESWTTTTCEIKDTSNARLRNRLFGYANDIAVEERQTKYGPAYQLIEDSI